ncbi:hypothetical protein F5876DRAFT_63161 [Lentinula aff. lateritia]|uniref:Uncharacterized protein n=1 Tax=Lentinula aff. lateritia TaxID=2804960 RepID=A0ACC1U918_9AGAR|nr:hypothetical protein F5876DRAFT_63161 [Lentinula aff. lateritia]
MNNLQYFENRPFGNIWPGNPDGVAGYPAVLSNPQIYYGGKTNTSGATITPIPVAPSPIAESIPPPPSSQGADPHARKRKRKNPKTEAPKKKTKKYTKPRYPPNPDFGFLRMDTSAPSTSPGIYLFNWQAQVPGGDQDSLDLNATVQQNGDQSQLAIGPEVQRDVGSYNQSPQPFAHTDYQQSQSLQFHQEGQYLSDAQQVYGHSSHLAAQAQDQVGFYEKVARLKQAMTLQQSRQENMIIAYRQYLAFHQQQQHARTVPQISYHQPYQNPNGAFQQSGLPSCPGGIQGGMSFAQIGTPSPGSADFQPSHQGFAASSSSASTLCFAPTLDSTVPSSYSRDCWSHSGHQMMLDSDRGVQALDAQQQEQEHGVQQFQPQFLPQSATFDFTFQSQDIRGMTDAPSQVEQTMAMESENDREVDNGDESDNESLFGGGYGEGEGFALPGSKDATVLIPTVNAMSRAYEVEDDDDDFLSAAFSADEPAQGLPPAAVIHARPKLTKAASIFDLEAELQKNYDLLKSPSPSPASFPVAKLAKGQVGSTKRKTRKRGTSEKRPARETIPQSSSSSILGKHPREITNSELDDPNSVWIHPDELSVELLRRHYGVQLMKVPDCPSGVICCLPPLQYTHDDLGQVVNAIEEDTTETMSVTSKRKICSFAIDTATPAEVELHFHFHRIATESKMRMAHAAGLHSTYQCMWHYDERDKTEIQGRARGFRRGIFCHEVSFTKSSSFNTYGALARHWNTHAAHKLLQRFCPLLGCNEVLFQIRQGRSHSHSLSPPSTRKVSNALQFFFLDENYRTCLRSPKSPIRKLPNEVMLRILDYACDMNDLFANNIEAMPASSISSEISIYFMVPHTHGKLLIFPFSIYISASSLCVSSSVAEPLSQPLSQHYAESSTAAITSIDRENSVQRGRPGQRRKAATPPRPYRSCDRYCRDQQSGFGCDKARSSFTSEPGAN